MRVPQQVRGQTGAGGERHSDESEVPGDRTAGRVLAVLVFGTGQRLLEAESESSGLGGEQGAHCQRPLAHSRQRPQ